MVFGRKKKEPEVVEEAQDDNQLDLAYGSHDGNDDVSSEEGDSLPPPPPGTASKQNLLHDDSHTIEDSPSIEANDVGVSMLSDPDPSIEEKKEPDPNRRNKMLIIFACFASFCILLGLAIKYGSSRQQSESSANSGPNDTDADVSFDSPISDGEEEDITLSNTIPEEDIFTNDNIPIVQETTEDIGPNVTEQTDTSIGVATTTGNSSDSEKTTVPTIDSSVDSTEGATSDETSDGTTPGTDIVTGAVTIDRGINNDNTRPTDVTDNFNTGDNDTDESTEVECVFDQIFASSSCENEVASASISICLVEETSDQFWAWIETPQAYAPFRERDWGWVRDDTQREIMGLPEGVYVLGLYSNGGEDMVEYPLIASSEFTIMCN